MSFFVSNDFIPDDSYNIHSIADFVIAYLKTGYAKELK